MRYRCLVFDHDDTVVNSTATIHYPSFVEYLREYFPDRSCTLEHYFLKNFDPGFIPMCREEYGMSDRDLALEVRFWQEYVRTRIPRAYPGIREIMERQKAEGGLIAVISHSMEGNILRDYRENGLPEPDAVYGWDLPEEQRKPNPYALEEIKRRYGLAPEEILVVDDMKFAVAMARSAGTPIAFAGWGRKEFPNICQEMEKLCDFSFYSTEEFKKFLFS